MENFRDIKKTQIIGINRVKEKNRKRKQKIKKIIR